MCSRGQGRPRGLHLWYSPIHSTFTKDPAHHIPNQTEIAAEEFCPKSLLRKQNEIDFIESHIQILHHLKIVQKLFCKPTANSTASLGLLSTN